MLNSEDLAKFLKLSLAIQILLRCCLVDTDINHAYRLLCKYCTELILVHFPHGIMHLIDRLTSKQLYRSSTIKPNHHYSTHISKCARNYGPLYDFWTFLFEQLKKVLKSYNTN
jgi:hypothetical protein